jgi:hypothetical protein
MQSSGATTPEPEASRQYPEDPGPEEEGEEEDEEEEKTRTSKYGGDGHHGREVEEEDEGEDRRWALLRPGVDEADGKWWNDEPTPVPIQWQAQQYSGLSMLARATRQQQQLLLHPQYQPQVDVGVGVGTEGEDDDLAEAALHLVEALGEGGPVVREVATQKGDTVEEENENENEEDGEEDWAAAVVSGVNACSLDAVLSCCTTATTTVRTYARACVA